MLAPPGARTPGAISPLPTPPPAYARHATSGRDLCFVILKGQLGQERGGGPDAHTPSADTDKVLLVWVPQAIDDVSAFLPRKSCP